MYQSASALVLELCITRLVRFGVTMCQSASVLVLELCISRLVCFSCNYVSVRKCPCVGTVYQSASVLLL
jgi:hypothetical protein